MKAGQQGQESRRIDAFILEKKERTTERSAITVMSDVSAYCYTCNTRFVLSREGSEAGELACAHCGSDFIEVTGQSESSGNVTNDNTEVDQNVASGSFFLQPGLSVGVRVSTVVDSNLHDILESIFPRLGDSDVLNIGDFSLGGGSLDRIMEQLADAHQPVARPADPQTVSALPRLVLGDDEASATDSCPVCHEEYKGGDELITLPCSHSFHGSCIRSWLEEHNTCPMCRLALPEADAAEPGATGMGSSQEEGSAADDFEATGPTSTEETRHSVELNSEREDPRGGQSGAGSGESDLTQRIHGAQRELEGLQRRLSQQLSEQHRLQSQIQLLQDQRAALQSEYSSLHTQGREAARRLNALVERQGSMMTRSESLFSRIAGAASRLRQALSRYGDGMGPAEQGPDPNGQQQNTGRDRGN